MQERQERQERREDAKQRLAATLLIDGRVMLPRLFVPFWAWKQETHVCHLRRHWSEGVKEPPHFDGLTVPIENLLTDFLSLAGASDDAVVAFVQKWGMLGITAWQHWAALPDRIPRSRREPRYVSEPIETYRIWARSAQAVLNVKGALTDNETAKNQDSNALRYAPLWTEAYWERYANDKDGASPLEPPRMFGGLEEFSILPGLLPETDTFLTDPPDEKHELTVQAKTYAGMVLSRFLAGWVQIAGKAEFVPRPRTETMIGRNDLGPDDFDLAWTLDARIGSFGRLFYQGAYHWWPDGGPPGEQLFYIDHIKNDFIGRSCLAHLGIQLLAALAQPVPRCVQCGRYYPASSRKVRDDGRMKPLCSAECRHHRENDLQRERARTRRAQIEKKQPIDFNDKS